jgi:hypothetical protein
MKERSLLYFITAVVATVLFIVAFIVRFLDWFPLYGVLVIPGMHKLFFPLVLLWVGYYFENKGFLLAATTIITVFFGFQMDYAGILSGTPHVLSSLAPIVRTTYVLGFMLMAASVVLGFFTWHVLHAKKHQH